MSARERGAEAALVVVGFGAAVYVLFAPVFDDLSGQVIAGGPGRIQADAYLMIWILSWGSWAIWNQPTEFFQANILHPAPSMLAGTEHMVGFLPLFAPVYYLSGNNVLAYQVTLLSSLTLSGAGMYALLRHWNCSRWGAVFGGFLMIASPGFYKGAFAVQMTAWFYLPVALIFFDRVIERGRARDAALLATALALQLLCSFYLAYMALAIVAFYGLVVVGWDGLVRRKLAWRNVLMAGVAVAAAGLVLVAFALPYAARAATGEIPDQVAEGIAWYSTVPSWQPYLKSPLLGPGLSRSFYLGLIPLALAIYAAVRATSLGAARVFGLWAAALSCVILAAGPKGMFAGFDLPPLYDLFLMIPGFSSVRGPNRFALAVNFAVAGLAGLALAELLHRVGRSRWTVGALWVGLVALTYLEFGDFQFRHYVARPSIGADMPGIYRRLASLERGVLLELPAGLQRGFVQLLRESQYGFHSTSHWHRILNGYTGYLPDSTDDLMIIAAALPDQRALRQLVRMSGLDYIAVHLDGMPKGTAKRWSTAPGLELLAASRGHQLFRVTERFPTDLQERLLSRQGSDRTYDGMAIETVPATERTASIAFSPPAPSSVVPGLAQTFELSLRNDSARVWPGIAPDRTGVVHWAARWTELQSGETTENLRLAPLPFDLEPGAEVQTFVSMPAPGKAGVYQLEVGLSQAGEWFGGSAVAQPVTTASMKRMKNRARGRKK